MPDYGKILLLAYGNPGRRDDGLGPALAAAVETLGLPNVRVEADYQLTVEDAALVAEHDVVIFTDASVAGTAPFYFRRLAPAGPATGFSSHSVDPVGVLTLARELFGARPHGYVLGLRGYEFNEFGETLSAGARRNLSAATAFLSQVLRTGEFTEIGIAPDGVSAREEAGSTEDTRWSTAST